MSGHPVRRRLILQSVVALVLVSLLVVVFVGSLSVSWYPPPQNSALQRQGPPPPTPLHIPLPRVPRYKLPAEPPTPPPIPVVELSFFRPPGDEVDCDLVLQSVATLYNESKARQAAWSAAGRPHTVVAPKGKDVSEIHILMVGDSWGRLSTLAIARHIDACRLRLPAPLIERDECTLHHITDEAGHTVYQLSKSALGLAPASTHEDAGLLRIHLHYHVNRHKALVAPYLESVLGSATPTPSISAGTFPRQAQCRRSVSQLVPETGGQVPLCLCEDTLMLRQNRQRRVPVDAVQVFTGMWDAQIQKMHFDLFEFGDGRVDWYFRQMRFSPNLRAYPYISWEDNLQRFRHLLADTYVASVRETVARASVPPGVPMPRVLLSYIPRVNCKSFKFTYMPTLNSTQRCEELAWPLHDILNEAVGAAYGKPAMNFPSVDPPEWLRLVDYRPLSVTETSLYHDETPTCIPSVEMCQMFDGAHFDTHITLHEVDDCIRACARRAHRMFWDNLRTPS